MMDPLARTCIHDFPTELLRHIFQFLPLFSRDIPRERPLALESRKQEDWHKDPLSWRAPAWRPPGLAIYHVCRRWRTVVHNSQDLWTIIPLRDPVLAELALARSRSASICIHIDLGLLDLLPDYLNTARKVVEHMPRAHEISMSGERLGPIGPSAWKTFVTQAVNFLQQHPAPLLESFQLRDSLGERLPDDIFQGVCPRLCEVRVSHTVGPASCLLAAPLTVFGLDHGAVGITPENPEQLIQADTAQYALYKWAYLSAALKNFSNLRELSLCHIRNGPSLFVGPLERHTLQFPRLDKLVLSGDISHVKHCLVSLSVSATIELHLRCNVGLGFSADGLATETFGQVVDIIHDMMDDHGRNVDDSGLAFRHLGVRWVHPPCSGPLL
ncbi:hypothetical protein FA95DRAFT_1017470 [Auriscalpium vulgare]|uniref:Uncharacterized protein n=1 Tax=Auriscalpium vulgare TaxID=40419 RepID=A0ACB8RXZ5_9AGAM|nr:hypothetical protein FA95DRAFT_1017470 [Auriscalpium vulgare]